jgi:Ca-activated chloride channel family protein
VEDALVQEPGELSPMVFIYDSSGSMWGQIKGKAKVAIAREVMAETVARLPASQRVGLVAYGHRNEGDCEDVQNLLVNANKDQVPPALDSIRPLGKTPLAWSATQVIEQLRNDQQKATIILLTDGVESCGGNLCEVVKAARESGVEFVMHIVGFGLQAGETGPLVCAAEAGSGQYFDAASAEELAEGLYEATAQTVDAAINISVSATKNGEPLDVYIEAFTPGEKKAVQLARSYHMGARFYLPPGRYDLKVSALENTDLEPQWLKGVEVTDETLSEHMLSFDAGTVRFNVLNNGEGWDSMIKLRANGVVVSQARTYGRATDMQVPPGSYSAQVQVLAVEGATTSFEVSEIEVKAGGVTDVVHPFESGIAMIGVRSGEMLVDAVVNFHDRRSGKNVAGSRTYTQPGTNPRKFVLLPGIYTVKYATLGEHKGQEGELEITINPGATEERVVNLQSEH